MRPSKFVVLVWLIIYCVSVMGSQDYDLTNRVTDAVEPVSIGEVILSFSLFSHLLFAAAAYLILELIQPVEYNPRRAAFQASAGVKIRKSLAKKKKLLRALPLAIRRKEVREARKALDFKFVVEAVPSQDLPTKREDEENDCSSEEENEEMRRAREALGRESDEMRKERKFQRISYSLYATAARLASFWNHFDYLQNQEAARNEELEFQEQLKKDKERREEEKRQEKIRERERKAEEELCRYHYHRIQNDIREFEERELYNRTKLRIEKDIRDFEEREYQRIYNQHRARIERDIELGRKRDAERIEKERQRIQTIQQQNNQFSFPQANLISTPLPSFNSPSTPTVSTTSTYKPRFATPQDNRRRVVRPGKKFQSR